MSFLIIAFLAPKDSPKSVSGGFLSETIIYVTWSIIPVPSQNGIILSYEIAYRKKDSEEEWNLKTVNGQTLRVEIARLDYYTLYNFKVAGRTEAGMGPYSDPISIRTDANSKNACYSSCT